ncbi:hypothetical protein [Bifidobacterium xylocopae]|nr:hypothetical protein [Bifidobacterium xylocopae]
MSHVADVVALADPTGALTRRDAAAGSVLVLVNLTKSLTTPMPKIV